MQQNRKRQNEHGNVFLFIILGIVLFTALSFTVSRGLRSDTTSNLTKRQAELAASDILSYAQKIERAVDRLRRNGCSENDISLANQMVSGYEHTPVAPDKCKVFDESGGRISWQKPPEGSNDGSEYLFSASYIGTTDFTTQFLGTAATELVIVLPNTDHDICQTINDKTNGYTTWEGPNTHNTFKFIGAYPAAGALATISHPTLETPSTGCFCDSFFPSCPATEPHYFYHTLIVR